jgi:alcohol dehydrogenase (cytochrome c)/quinohemoprotein ethanol dehydrogenase
MLSGHLLAWDPVLQKAVWRYQQAGPGNGGVLATAGNLVFQGNIIGEFAAYAADNGERLWAFPTQTGVTAGPVTYAIDGEQYVSVAKPGVDIQARCFGAVTGATRPGADPVAGRPRAEGER